MPANLREKDHPIFKPLHTNLALIKTYFFHCKLVPWLSLYHMQRYTAARSNAVAAKLVGGSLMWL